MQRKLYVHATSVHPRFDTRIYRKMCCSLLDAGQQVSLIVADGKGDSKTDKGVVIRDVGASSSRLSRMLWAPFRVLSCLFLQPKDAIFHLHDPELIPIGLVLALSGRMVIFDSHEDILADLKQKPYLGSFGKMVLGPIAHLVLKISLPRFASVICATPSISRSLEQITNKLEVVNNYPILRGPAGKHQRELKSPDNFIYVGAIDEARGILQLIQALELVTEDVTLTLCGEFSEHETFVTAKSMKGWEKVDFRGYVKPDALESLYRESLCGVVTFLATENHVESRPNKLFEYMNEGLAVLASDFGEWRSLLEKADCGIFVDPASPKSIANAIRWIIDHREGAIEMGSKGNAFVRAKYSWDSEFKKLTGVYEDCSGSNF